MLRSMTGFGKTEGTIGNKKFTIELRSLNSKQLDLNMRIPGTYREKELELRSWLSENIQRGKADLLVYYESLEAEKRMAINKPLMHAYYEDLKSFANEAKIESGDFINAIMRIPDVLKPESTELDEEEWASLFSLIKDAFHRFDIYRKLEGEKLTHDFHKRIDLILENRLALNEPIASRNQRVREKLRANRDQFLQICTKFFAHALVAARNGLVERQPIFKY
ncbi:MAG: YicC/YloC family endoribonuclease [Flavobacteriales bacterium]